MAIIQEDKINLVVSNASANVNVVASSSGKTNVTVLKNDITAAERAKLAGIEAGATADLTASEIKTLYESNSDTNALTDANNTKLGYISIGNNRDIDVMNAAILVNNEKPYRIQPLNQAGGIYLEHRDISNSPLDPVVKPKMPDASATGAGVVTPNAQTFGGVKTFNDGLAGNLTGNVTGNVTGDLTGNADTVTNGVYITGDQTIAGNKTFSGTTTLSGTNIVSGSTIFTGTLTSNNTVSFNSGMSVTGATNLGTVNATSLSVSSINFLSGSSTISTITGTAPEDLEIRSDGNAIIKLDYDDDQSNQKFKVVNSADAVRFSVDEDGTVTVNSAFSFPTSDGTTGQVMTTNGSGTLSWSSPVGSIEDLSDVNIIGTPSQGDVLTYNSGSSQWMKSSSLQDLLGIVKSSSGTQVYNTSLDTSAGYVDLQSTSAKMGLGGTFLTASQTSPGVLTFSVATGASGTETQFDAFTLTGTTTTDVADLLLEPGCNFKIEATSGGDAQIRNYPSNTADTTITLPQSSGTLAIASDIPTSIDDLSDVDTSTVAPTDGQALVWDNANSKWEPGSAGSASPWTTSGSDIYYTTGNVGVGTTTPAAPLHIVGNIKTTGSLFYGSSGLHQLGEASNKGIFIGQSNSANLANGGVVIGNNAGRFNSGIGNVAIGGNAGYRGSYSNNQVAIGDGSNSGASAYSKSSSIGIGVNSNYNGSTNTTSVGTSTGANSPSSYTNSAFFGYQAGHSGGNNSVFVGYEAGKSDGVQTVDNTVAVGYQALTALTTGAGNTAVGYQAGAALTTGTNNTFLGYQAGDSILQSNNTIIGSGAGVNLANVSGAVIMGSGAAAAANGTTYGVVIGYQAAGSAAQNAGNSGVVIGFRAGQSNTGTGNVLLGANSGKTGDGSNNVFIGTNSGYSETGSNKLYIENSNSTTPLIYGEFDNDILRVNGSFEVTGGMTADDGGLTAAGDYGKGAEVWYQGTSTPTAGSVYYLDSSGNWANTDASAVATAKGMLSVSAGADSDVDGMVIKGFVYVGTDPGGSVGDVVYLSETANQLTTTAPTTASAVVRVCGYKVGTNIVYFDPSKDWIELS